MKIYQPINYCNNLFIAIITCVSIITIKPINGEEIDTFLKRGVSGKITASDIHDKFQGVVFIGDKIVSVDRNALIGIINQYSDLEVNIEVKDFEILNKIETKVDGKPTIISVVYRSKTKSKIGSSMTESDGTSHDIVLCFPDGKYQFLLSSSRQ